MLNSFSSPQSVMSPTAMLQVRPKPTKPHLSQDGTADDIDSARDFTFTRAKSRPETAVSMSSYAHSGAYEERESWEGIVLSVSGEVMRARLKDPSNQKNDEHADFQIRDLQKFDRDLVTPGALFHWTVGSWTSEMGLQQMISNLRFKRIPVVSLTVLEKAQQEADKLKSLFS